MENFNKKLGLMAIVVLLLVTVLSGCKSVSKIDTSIDEPAIKYVTNLASSQWDEVLQQSTGDQLAIYTQLLPVLKNVQQTSEIKKVEVTERAISSDKNTAFLTIHLVRTLTLPEYGSSLDDRQLLLSMKKIDGHWKVFKMDIVSDLKTRLN